MSARIAAVPEEIGSLRRLSLRLERIRTSLLRLENSVDLTPFGKRRESALNLLHYIAFRRFDLRRDQAHLTRLALSSLGRSESHVLYTLDAVLDWLSRSHTVPGGSRGSPTGPDPSRGRKLLDRNARDLLGPSRRGRGVRIMVTLPTEAAKDYRLVRSLLESGTDLARINCAHDGPAEWTQMLRNIHRAERALGRRCRIELDLGGPKLRTGPVRPGPPVLKLRPKRDPLGRATAPALVPVVPALRPGAAQEAGRALPVNGEWLRRRHADESVELRDARGSPRALRLVLDAGGGLLAEAWKTTYLTSGTRLTARSPRGRKDSTRVGDLPPSEQRIRLSVGEKLVVSARAAPGETARLDPRGRVRRPAHISCTLPEAFRYVRPGEAIWLDDGRIGGTIRSTTPDRLIVEVTQTPEGGAWLAADKGINLPDTSLEVPPLSPQDLEDLRFAVRHADLVGYSFVQTPEDLDRLRSELSRLGRPRMGVVVKIETRRGFDHLPDILLAALRRPPMGIMIARGDLAVEVGFERLAEVQEEVLWLCEAAHMPAIWATQVLEGLTKSGQPSRAEVTDAAMGERAECVMLNKGPHVVEAVRALDSILRRMQSHQAKKTAMLRHLHVVERFLAHHRSFEADRPSPSARRPRRGGRRPHRRAGGPRTFNED